MCGCAGSGQGAEVAKLRWVGEILFERTGRYQDQIPPLALAKGDPSPLCPLEFLRAERQRRRSGLPGGGGGGA